MRIDQLRGGIGIPMLRPALGKHIFFLGREDREFLDLRKIAVETILAARCGD